MANSSKIEIKSFSDYWTIYTKFEWTFKEYFSQRDVLDVQEETIRVSKEDSCLYEMDSFRDSRFVDNHEEYIVTQDYLIYDSISFEYQ